VDGTTRRDANASPAPGGQVQGEPGSSWCMATSQSLVPLHTLSIDKALGDPIRLQLVDVLRKHAGKVCVCELVPLFDISQPTLSHHLKKLRDAGIVDSERRGLWAYYYVIPDALEEFSAWLT
jgi:DNA-binding transcriptional ArsR family regulator